MEKLTKRSDGIFETASGLFAVSLKRSSGSDGENNWFDYMPQSWGEPVRIRWPARDEIAVIDHVYATTLFRLRYGTTITQVQADKWNDRIEEIEALRDAPALDPSAQPPAQAATLIPVSTGDATGGAAIDPNSLLLQPTPEEIADAAAKAALDNPPPNTQDGLGTQTDSEIGKEAAAAEGDPASLVPPVTSPEDQTDPVAETTGKVTKKRTLS